MAKSNFSALLEAKKQRTQNTAESNNEPQDAKENGAETNQENISNKVLNEAQLSQTSTDASALTDSTSQTNNNNADASRETVRRSYRIKTPHDKAIKVMSKFLKQGTEEEIVLKIFDYYFENSGEGKKAVQMVSLIEQS